MSIQGDFNKGFMGLALIASLTKVNKSIKDLGFNGYQELCRAINKLEIEIAKASDEGKPTVAMKELLAKYMQSKNKCRPSRFKVKEIRYKK